MQAIRSGAGSADDPDEKALRNHKNAVLFRQTPLNLSILCALGQDRRQFKHDQRASRCGHFRQNGFKIVSKRACGDSTQKIVTANFDHHNVIVRSYSFRHDFGFCRHCAGEGKVVNFYPGRFLHKQRPRLNPRINAGRQRVTNDKHLICGHTGHDWQCAMRKLLGGKPDHLGNQNHSC